MSIIAVSHVCTKHLTEIKILCVLPVMRFLPAYLVVFTQKIIRYIAKFLLTQMFMNADAAHKIASVSVGAFLQLSSDVFIFKRNI